MISGDNGRRNLTIPIPDPPKSLWTATDTTQDALSQKAIGFNCLDYYHHVNGPEAALSRHYMPPKDFVDTNCPDGLRLELMFPTCWDGVDTGLGGLNDHVAFSDMVMGGDCPENYSIRLPSIYYEVIWTTQAFSNVTGWFFLSNGDSSGTSYHGDFISGWDAATLELAVTPGPSQCNNESGEVADCAIFELVDENCSFVLPPAIASEDYYGPRYGLPGNVTLDR